MKHVIRSSELVRVSCLSVAAAVIAACGVRSAGASVPGDQSPCSITLSGAKTGTFSCADSRMAVYGVKEGKSQMLVRSNDGQGFITIGIKFPGMPAAKSYKSSDAGAAEGIWVGNGGARWVAKGNTEPGAVGSYVVTLTDVKEIPYATDAKGYHIHGTATATLLPDPDTAAKGTITLTAKF